MVMNPMGPESVKNHQIPRIEWYFLQQKHQDIPFFPRESAKKSPNYHQNSKGFQNPNIYKLLYFSMNPIENSIILRTKCKWRCTGHRAYPRGFVTHYFLVGG